MFVITIDHQVHMHACAWLKGVRPFLHIHMIPGYLKGTIWYIYVYIDIYRERERGYLV